MPATAPPPSPTAPRRRHLPQRRLLPGVVRHDQQHPIQPERLAAAQRGRDVTQVGRIEGSSEDPDRRGHESSSLGRPALTEVGQAVALGHGHERSRQLAAWPASVGAGRPRLSTRGGVDRDLRREPSTRLTWVTSRRRFAAARPSSWIGSCWSWPTTPGRSRRCGRSPRRRIGWRWSAARWPASRASRSASSRSAEVGRATRSTRCTSSRRPRACGAPGSSSAPTCRGRSAAGSDRRSCAGWCGSPC